MRYLDTRNYLSGEVLTKVDRASMAHSLETWVPLLDHGLLEFAWSLSPRQLIRRRQSKLADRPTARSSDVRGYRKSSKDGIRSAVGDLAVRAAPRLGGKPALGKGAIGRKHSQSRAGQGNLVGAFVRLPEYAQSALVTIDLSNVV